MAEPMLDSDWPVAGCTFKASDVCYTHDRMGEECLLEEIRRLREEGARVRDHLWCLECGSPCKDPDRHAHPCEDPGPLKGAPHLDVSPLKLHRCGRRPANLRGVGGKRVCIIHFLAAEVGGNGVRIVQEMSNLVTDYHTDNERLREAVHVRNEALQRGKELLAKCAAEHRDPQTRKEFEQEHAGHLLSARVMSAENTETMNIGATAILLVCRQDGAFWHGDLQVDY